MQSKVLVYFSYHLLFKSITNIHLIKQNGQKVE
jgi:hypothetical protein